MSLLALEPVKADLTPEDRVHTVLRDAILAIDIHDPATDLRLDERALSHCTMLATVADGLLLHMRAVRRRAMPEKRRAERSIVDHTRIIEALEDRDADPAARPVRDHTMRLHDHVRESWTALEARASGHKMSRHEAAPTPPGRKANGIGGT